MPDVDVEALPVADGGHGTVASAVAAGSSGAGRRGLTPHGRGVSSPKESLK
ncbi:hypothetical protein ABZ782_27705 [Streptomyces asoensis]